MRMRHVMGALTCMAVLMPACADAEPDRATPGELPAPAATGTLVARTGMFVDDAPPAAQLVFVGRDASIVPAGFDAGVFVPFSTFSVERNGIPNGFPAPATMAALLHAAGVRNGRIVIVGEPIPAGRAFAAFDYLGLADDVSLYDGGIAALRERMDTAPDATDTSAAPAATGDAASLETDVREDMIVDAEWVHARLNDPQVAILDARPPAEYTSETPGEGVTRPGHSPRAPNTSRAHATCTGRRSSSHRRCRRSSRRRSCGRSSARPAWTTTTRSSRTAGPAARRASCTPLRATSVTTCSSTTARTSTGAPPTTPSRRVPEARERAESRAVCAG